MAIAKGTSSRRQPPSGQPYFAPGTTLNLNTPAAKARGEAWRQSRQPGQAQPIAPPSQGTQYSPQQIRAAVARAQPPRSQPTGDPRQQRINAAEDPAFTRRLNDWSARNDPNEMRSVAGGQYSLRDYLKGYGSQTSDMSYLRRQWEASPQVSRPPQPSTTANNENGTPQEPPGGWDWQRHIDAERRIYPPQFGRGGQAGSGSKGPYPHGGEATQAIGEYDEPQPMPGGNPWSQDPGFIGTMAAGEYGDPQPRPGVGGQQPGWGGGWGGGSGGQQPGFNFNPNPVQAALNNSMGLFGSPFTQSVSGPFGNTQADMWNNMGGFVQAVNNQSGQQPVGTFDGPIQNQNTYNIRSLINQGNQMVQDGWQNPFMGGGFGNDMERKQPGGGQTAKAPSDFTTMALYETDPSYGPPRQSGGQAGGGWQMPAGGIDFTDPETGFRVRSPGDFPTRRAPPAGMDAKWV